MANDIQSLLGTGWGFPPEFNSRTAKVSLVSDNDDIQESLKILLSTSPGERILVPDFGCDMGRFLFADLDQNVVNDIQSVVSNAILKYEPRIELEQIQVDQDTINPGLIFININYIIRDTNSRENMVYPFYINEAKIPG
jgi:phage baseplate assembly protein W